MGKIVSDLAHNISGDLNVENMCTLAWKDNDYLALHWAVLGGFEGELAQHTYLCLFTKMREELMINGDLVLRNCWIVIPPTAVKGVLRHLHSLHQGTEKTKRLARQTVFWPGLTNDIATTIQTCTKCQYYWPSAIAEPLVQDTVSTIEKVTSDLFMFGSHHYLVYADRYSGYPLLSRFSSSPSSSDLIKEFRFYFSLMGTPNILRSDNGPQYRSSLFLDLLRDWGVQRPCRGHSENY
ncbi:uncharacterized protein K02A2.6-like [Tigriopus californicus]|uniref:uncharacterized protein K02A2.6-like n=1 Tax=Tigriopus californicus TaxID=6832 RepID=UPI0027DA3FC2|nr:uncharacterized protein K02A2.6-like [Tigriopus californicus]